MVNHPLLDLEMRNPGQVLCYSTLLFHLQNPSQIQSMMVQPGAMMEVLTGLGLVLGLVPSAISGLEVLANLVI